MDPTERLRAINAANSEDAAARARILAENREREARVPKRLEFLRRRRRIFSGSAGGSSPGGGFTSAASRQDQIGPASDFWEWAPPEDPDRARRNDSPLLRAPPSRSVRWRRRTLDGWKPPWR